MSQVEAHGHRLEEEEARRRAADAERLRSHEAANEAQLQLVRRAAAVLQLHRIGRSCPAVWTVAIPCAWAIQPW